LKVGFGSKHNRLRFAKRRVVFVEGEDDFRLLVNLRAVLVWRELSAGLGITALECGAFGSWQRVTTLAAGFDKALVHPSNGAIYDRDYLRRGTHKCWCVALDALEFLARA